MVLLDKYGKEYVYSVEERSLNLNNYLRFLTDESTSKVITPEGSFQLATVYSCIRILADAVAMTPFGLFQGAPGDPDIRQIYQGPFARLCKNASNLFNNFTFWQSMISSLQGWGNSYAAIVRNSRGVPEQLIYLHPSSVSIIETTDPRFVFLSGEVPFVYQVSTGAQTSYVKPEDMIHLVLFTYDGLFGLSPIALHQDSMQVENEQTKYGRSFYADGAKITGVIESPLKSSRENSTEFVTWFNQFYSGSGAGRVAFLPNGLQFKQASVVNPQDAQWVDSRKLTRQEIASIFRVPVYLLGDLERATWGNVSQLSAEFVRYSLQPLYTLIETELNRKLLDNAESMFYEYDPSRLLRGTTEERYRAYNLGILGGYLSPAEARQRENLPYEPELHRFQTMPGAGQIGAGEEPEPEPDSTRSLTFDVAMGAFV